MEDLCRKIALMTESDFENIRVAFFLPELKGGGAERVFLDLCTYLGKKKIFADLIVGNAKGELATKLPDNINVFNLNSGRVIRALPGLVRYLNSERPAALFSTLDHANIVAMIAHKLARHQFRLVIRVANRLTESYQRPPGFRSRLIRYLVKAMYPYADEILAVSQGVAFDLSKFCKITKDNVTVIYNPAFTPRIQQGLNTDLGTTGFESDGKALVLGVGSLTRQKDFSTLLKAFAKVRKNVPLRLAILGEGEERNALMGLAEELGVADDLSLPGYVENPFVFMRHASVFVLSSRWEGLPNVLVQAMACGCPVVSADCPSGPREILENGRFGKLVPVGNVRMLAEAILATIKERPNSEAGIERAKEFSIEKIADQYLSLALPNYSRAK